jgi:hypothetical protein
MGYDNAWGTILMFPLGVVPYSYAFSFFFTKESTAQTVILFSNIVAGSIGGMAIFILRMIPDTMWHGDFYSKLLKVFPTFCISNSIIYDGSKQIFNSSRIYAQFEYPDLEDISLEGWDLGNVGGDMVALTIHMCVGLLIIILIEVGAFSWVNAISKNKQLKVEHAPIQDPDDDVLEEEKRV